MLPQTREQTGVCNRVLRPASGPILLRSWVERLLAEPQWRREARNLSDSFRRCSGAGAAADKILSVIP